MGPVPIFNSPSPSIIVECPTFTPGTSVIEFNFPLGKIPMSNPRSLLLGLLLLDII